MHRISQLDGAHKRQMHRPHLQRHLLKAFVVILVFNLLTDINVTCAIANAADPADLGERMASRYTEQLNIIVQLIDEPLAGSGMSPKEFVSQGQSAFDKALKVFPDETLPHAHALFAKLCVKVGNYEKSLDLFDEAIRRASIPLNDNNHSLTDDDDDDDEKIPQVSQEAAEAEALVTQLVLERNRAHFSHLQMQLDKWDNANNALHRGGIPPETSPMDPLSVVEHQLAIFPNPHPQSLFDKASFMVLLLDSPTEDDTVNRTSKAWESYEIFTKAQTWAFGAYTHGKKRNLAGGKPCSGKEHGFGMAVGGRAWSNYALESYPYQHTEINYDGTQSFMGVVTLQNVIISGKDAVISGYGDNCQVFVPHRYVNLADNIPMVTSWESSVHELTMGDNPLWLTHIPSNDLNAFGGMIGKDAIGNDELIIPDPKPKTASRGFDSAVLLTGYASDNYYHFVSEVLPSFVIMKDQVHNAISKSNNDRKEPKDIVIVPNMQHEYVTGFLKLLLPNAWSDGALSKNVVQWGTPKGNSNATSKFLTPHPVAYVRRLYAATWDQPKEAPPPLSGAAHCLTPRPLLYAMQQAVWNAVSDLRPKGKRGGAKLRVVFCSRSSSATRSLNQENELFVLINEAVSALDGEVIRFEKERKKTESTSSSSPLDFIIDSVELFRSAAVVVGVHGAALANIAFCTHGTTVVELGFESLPQASHYRHLSSALGLKHVDVWLERDSRSLGATQVKLRQGGAQEVVDAIVTGLRQKSGGHTEF